MKPPTPILRTRARHSVCGALLCLALTLLLCYFPNLGAPWLRSSYDFAFLFRPKGPPPPEVVIIYLDNQTYRDLRQEPASFDRGLLADLVDQMTDDQANVVVLDIWFQLPRSLKSGSRLSDPGDLRLAQAIERNRKVVLAVVRGEMSTTEVDSVTTLLPFEQLRKAGAYLGKSQARADDQDLIRSFDHGTIEDPGFAWIAAQVAGAKLSTPGGQPENELWLNYYGEPMTLRSFSFSQVVGTGKQPKGLFKGANVFVGSRPEPKYPQERISDAFRSPYSIWTKQRIPGVEVAATAFANLLRGDSLRILDETSHLRLFILGALLFAGGGVWLRPWWAVGASFLAALVIVLVSCTWVWKSHVWLNWMLLAAFQVPFALAWSLFSHTRLLRNEKEFLELTLTRTLQQVEETRKEKEREKAKEAAQPAEPAAIGKSGSDGAPGVADHVLVRRVGKGGYGEVWLARNAIGLHHVVKLVHRQDFTDDGPYEREFRGIQKFMPISRSHPGFVHILQVGRNDERKFFYYVMETGDDEQAGQQINPETYTPKNLGSVIRQKGALPAKECVELGAALAEALHHLHQQQLIHRDIKPANIIYVNGRPKLADIGLVTELQSTNQDVSRLGTDGFMAPEGPGTAASDVYSLGKVLYEACMGLDRRRFPELPTALYESDDITERMELNRIIIHACEPNPDDRYATAAELAAELRELAGRMA